MLSTDLRTSDVGDHNLNNGRGGLDSNRGGVERPHRGVSGSRSHVRAGVCPRPVSGAARGHAGRPLPRTRRRPLALHLQLRQCRRPHLWRTPYRYRRRCL